MTDTMTRLRLPAGTIMRFTPKGRHDWRESTFNLDGPVVLRDDDCSSLPYYARPSGSQDTFWFQEDQLEEILDDFPAPPEEGSFIQEVRENLQWWAEKSGEPILDSVDDQIQALREHQPFSDRAHPDYVIVPRNEWVTTGPGKDYFGKVMRYARKYRAGQTLPTEGLTGSTGGAPESDVVSPEVAALRAEVEDLTRQITERDNRYHQERTRHQEDIDLIGNRLMEEARRRDWCSEYDEVVDSLNGNLHITLPERTSDYTVTWQETYTVTINRSESGIEARSAEAAEEYAQESGTETFEDAIADRLRSYFNVEGVTYDSAEEYEAEQE